MDYSFAPGNTGQDRRARQMFTRRPNTTLINANRHRNTVKQFVDHIASNGGIAKPIEDHLLASHASSQGFLFVSLFPGQRGPSQFETIESTIGNAARSIEIADATIGYTSPPITKNFHIKGCNIGKARPFLVKLKEALGDHVHVTAPKHFHYLNRRNRLGVFEGMAYEFNINRNAPFNSKADVLAAFQAGGFTRIDGSPVPNADWNSWLPQRLARGQLRRRRRLRRALRVNLGMAIVNTRTLSFPIGFRVTPNRFTYTIGFPNAGSVPNGNAARQTALENALNADPTFDNTHDFPVYERWGYNSIANFIAGYNWRFVKQGKNLICRGLRYEYTVLPPVLDLNTGNLIFNFYPNNGLAQPPILNGLVETDNRFFETA